MKTVHNDERKCFELYDADGEKLGEIEYMRGGNNELFATHTEVYPQHEGKGYAGVLLKALVEYANQQECTIVPLCQYVAAAFRKDPEKYSSVIKK